MNPANNQRMEDVTPSDPRLTEEAIPLAAAIVSDVLGLTVQRATPLLGMGSVNLILFVETNGAEIVVRLNKPEDDSAKALGEYEKERWCIQRASAAGIPSPQVFAVGERYGRAFMLQKRVQGVNGKHSALAPADLMRILGGYARRIHALPANGFGDTVEKFENGEAQSGWLGFVDYNLGELTASDPLIALGVYPIERRNAIREAFEGLRSAPLRVGLNHGDLARRNAIVEESGRVSLLDWGCAEMHIVPHYELSAILHWHAPDNDNLSAFLEGYGFTAEEWAALLPELNAFALLKAFDLVRWAIDRSPERITEVAERAARLLMALP